LVDAERGFDDAFDQLWLQVNELRAEWISTAQKLTGEVQSARQAGDNESLWRLWHDANSCAQRASEDFQLLLVGPITRLTDVAWKLPKRASYRRRLALAKYASLIRDDSRVLQRPADLAELWLELTGELERVERRDETERREAAEVEAAKAYSNVEADFGLEAA